MERISGIGYLAGAIAICGFMWGISRIATSEQGGEQYKIRRMELDLQSQAWNIAKRELKEQLENGLITKEQYVSKMDALLALAGGLHPATRPTTAPSIEE